MIEFNAEKHEYRVDGKKVPSVTEILSLLSYDTFAQIDKATLEYASKRGTAIHEATEAIDMGCEAEIDGETEPYIRAYLDFIQDYKPSWYGIEDVVANEQLGYAGTIDRHGKMGNTDVILDIKTIGSPSRLDYTKVCLQTYLYSLCLDYENPRLFALFLKKDGTYRLFDCLAWWREKQIEPIYNGAKDILVCFDTINALKKGKRNDR